MSSYAVTRNGKRYYLIDTPRYDDSSRTDVDILKDVAANLVTSYKDGIQLSALLYVHRITDNRFPRSANLSLSTFKELCGLDNFANVIFVTTMWDQVEEIEGERREVVLSNKPRYWGNMVSRGSRIARHHNSRASALQILDM
jgi:hypothetical protein